MVNQPAEHPSVRPPGDLQGSRVGPYRLSQRIGEGGMGVVYLGLDESQRAVAVKVLRPHVAGDPDARKRLRREVDTLQRIRHERIARVLDADVDGPLPFVVTEYVPAVSLDKLVKDDGPLPADQLIRLGFGLGDALGAIHGAGVIHRDLKPANVMMSDGDPVVIDFGIAHIADDSRLTMTGLVMGTPGYLSPELIEGGSVDRATDWWGWAATLAFAATARPPFGRGPMEVVLDRVRRGEADLTGVPDPLVDVLRAALSPDPGARPRPAELRSALTSADEARGTLPTMAIATATQAVPVSDVPATQVSAVPATQVSAVPATQVSAVPATQVSAVPATQVSAVPATQVSAVPATQVTATPATRVSPVPPAVAPQPVVAPPPRVDRRRSSRAAAPAAAANLPVGRSHQPVGQSTGSYAQDAVARHAPVMPPPAMPAPQQHAAPDRVAPEYVAAPQPAMQQYGPPQQRAGFAHGHHSAAQSAGPQLAGQRQHQQVAVRPEQQLAHPQGAQQQAHAHQTAHPDHQAPRPLRSGTMCAGLVLLVAGFLTAPVLSMLALVLWSAFARTIDRITRSVGKRRYVNGRRASDVVFGIAQSPLQLIPGTLWAVLAAVLPLLLAICGYFAMWAVLPTTSGGLVEPSALAAAGFVFALAHWWGPGGGSLRRGTRTLARSLTPGRPGAVFAVCLLLIVTIAVLTVRWHAGGVDWYPLDIDPLTQVVGVTPGDLLRGSN